MRTVEVVLRGSSLVVWQIKWMKASRVQTMDRVGCSLRKQVHVVALRSQPDADPT